MSRQIKVASVQMDATPAPTIERLERAARQIAAAADEGAQLVVLPELFNTGYEYSDANYGRAETLSGKTVQWMKEQAARHNLHLAGSLMLLDGEDIFNSALLFAPDARMWRYDKNYPWNYERLYFRDNRQSPGTTIADTDLGKLGMLICWDSAHSDLWQAYAGKVDAMVAMSCPPRMNAVDIVFPDGFKVASRDLGGLLAAAASVEEVYFSGPGMDSHAAWMGVPVVQASSAGQISLTPPAQGLTKFAYFALRPDLWKRFRQLIRFDANFDTHTKIVDTDGKVVNQVEGDGDGVTVGVIMLSDTPPQPTRQQPPETYPGWVYFVADRLNLWVFRQSYTSNARREAMKGSSK